MHIEVVEFELDCPGHGRHRILVPVQGPYPTRCAHCFLQLRSRTEIRRFSLAGPLPSGVGSEAWIG
jgi:hypothetical protein